MKKFKQRERQKNNKYLKGKDKEGKKTEEAGRE